MAIDHIVVEHFSNSATKDWDLEFVKISLNELTVKGVINEIFRPLSTFSTEDNNVSQKNEEEVFLKLHCNCQGTLQHLRIIYDNICPITCHSCTKNFHGV